MVLSRNNKLRSVELGVVLVHNMTIISEDGAYRLYIQSEYGSFDTLMDKIWVAQIMLLLPKYLTKKASGKATLRRKNEALKITLKSQDASYPLEQGLVCVLEQNISLYIEESLLQKDYSYDGEHEKMVQGMIKEEQEYYSSYLIQEKILLIKKAIEEERYEDAAILRDDISKLINT